MIHIGICGEPGAAQVLTRRLAAATIISQKHPTAVTALPTYDNIYKGYAIPTVDESKALLLKVIGATKQSPCVIVAGVDEVQLLNATMAVGGMLPTGLGRLFLRILRRWQHEWYDVGLRILPVGTGIAVDWDTDPTVGRNIPIYGDSVVISKEDFKSLVTSTVHAVPKEEFVKRFSDKTCQSTVIDIMVAMYWPRVRLRGAMAKILCSRNVLLMPTRMPGRCGCSIGCKTRDSASAPTICTLQGEMIAKAGFMLYSSLAAKRQLSM